VIAMARRTLTPAQRVWLLNAAITAAALAIFLGVVRGLAHGSPPFSIPWWGLAAGFAVAERCVVHFHFRRSSHGFSLGELPLILGLVFSHPTDVVAGGLVGGLVALATDRHLPPVKVVFNLAQFSLGAGLATIVYAAIEGAGWTLGPRMWLAALTGAIASALMAVLLICAAISISEGGVTPRTVLRMVAMDVVVTTINTALACVSATVLASDPWAAVLLLIPAGAMLFGYRAYLAERQRHKGLEFLYDATRTFSRSPDIDRELQDLLCKALETFRVAVAEVVLLSSDGRPPLLTRLVAGEEAEVMEPVSQELADALCELVSDDERAVAFAPPYGNPALQAHFAAHGIEEGMVAMLPGETRQIGVMLLANRLGVRQAFAPQELQLFEALANNASVALQYDRLEHVVARLTELQRQLEHQAYYDSLTGLANRARFLDRTRDALNDGGGRTVAVLFIDLDDFKTINDSLGHAAGDALLRVVGRRLRHSVRPSDTAARLGGDEFAVLLREVAGPQEALAAAERIQAALRPAIRVGDRTFTVELSTGIALGRPGEMDADELIRNADVAMYRAKRSGKGSCSVFEPGMEVAVQRRHTLKEDLQRGIERREFTALYQPIVDLETNEVTAVEALLRWRHPRRGLVAPGDFIPLAEETGLIVPIGRMAIEDACCEAAAWREHDVLPGARLHVNISSVELDQPDLVPWLCATVRDAGLPAGQVVLEVTETALAADPHRASARLHELHDAGFVLALDDFGTGYSSLSRLQSLPIQVLKIPKPFVDNIAKGARASAIARAAIGLARALDLHVVAEGIERPEQLDTLRDLRCDLVQGYLLSRPVDAERVPAAGRAAAVIA
jgi:diguanylate cyclase (GGDEF)-like protein